MREINVRNLDIVEDSSLVDAVLIAKNNPEIILFKMHNGTYLLYKGVQRMKLKSEESYKVFTDREIILVLIREHVNHMVNAYHDIMSTEFSSDLRKSFEDSMVIEPTEREDEI